MKKSELRELIRECLHEELKSNRLTEGHEVFDLGRGYYADIDMDQYELHPERINVEIYKDTTGWQNPHYDKYITTVRSVDEAREYVADLREELAKDASGKLTESTLTAEEKVDAWHAGTRRENYKAAGIPKLNAFLEIAKRKGYTEIIDILETELDKRGVAVTPTPAATVTMSWEDLLKKAGELLYDIMSETDNLDYDDGDGYWQTEYTTWCDRCLYYTRLNNTELLSKLCDEYNMKLPNVEFYFYDDEDEEVSEIGYTATRDGDRLSEAVSPTYRATYDRLAKKFEPAIHDADRVWAEAVIWYGMDIDYYSSAMANTFKKAANKNISTGMTNVGIDTLCATGDTTKDTIFSDFIEQEAGNFDSSLGDSLYYENFICYNDGHYDYLNTMEDSFTGDINEVECIIGVDYASGANITWIRGEDDIEDLNDLLNI
jgi:hypothetical protein